MNVAQQQFLPFKRMTVFQSTEVLTVLPIFVVFYLHQIIRIWITGSVASQWISYKICTWVVVFFIPSDDDKH